MTKIAFVDVETTGTDPNRHHLWEIGVILRENGRDLEYCWQVWPDLTTADPMALKVNNFYTRCQVDKDADVHIAAHPDDAESNTRDWLTFDLARLLNGAVLAAANVTFDAAFLDRFLRAHGHAPAWDYHLLEIESYAAGALGFTPPWKLDKLASALSVPLLGDKERHTALADARLVRDVFNAASRYTP
jgi:DNA polymerase III epsilon subunit-like protein